MLVGLLNWEGFHGAALAIELVNLHHVEVQVVDDAVGAHGVVAEAQGRLLAEFEDLEHELDELI